MRAYLSLAIALLLAGGCLLIPDDQEKGTRVANRRPTVEITAGAMVEDSAGVDYKVNFQWRGADDDGVVLRFEYAIDDTTSEEAWQDTTGFGALLRFRATHPQGGDGMFTDWHTFYIRAIDNEYATSPVRKKYFNAKTIAPTSRITFPRLPPDPGTSLVQTFVVEWEGEDIDSSQPEKTPAFYEYKLIRVESTYDTTITRRIYTDDNVFYDSLQAGDKTRWVRVPGTTRQLILNREVTGAAGLVFALRAVDEAGAVEPVLEPMDNYFIFHVTDKVSKPRVTMTERSVGQHTYPNEGQVWSVEVPAETPIRFAWVGDAEFYGSKPGDTNYGLDVPDPQDDRYRDPHGIGGWIGWGKWEQMAEPLIFPVTEDGQVHTFYLRMRDISGQRSSEQLCTVRIRVVAFTLDRKALLVDDAKIGYGMNNQTQDETHDAFVARFIGRIRDFAPQGYDTHNTFVRTNQFQPEGGNPTIQTALALDDLARYETVIWSFNYLRGSTSGIWFHENESPPGAATRTDKRMLSSFLAAGGKLFLFGNRSLSALLDISSNPLEGGQGGGDYPKLPPQAGASDQDWWETNFVWKFLHVRNQIIGIDPYDCYNTPPNEHQRWRDGLIRCVSENPAYPDLVIDAAKYDTERFSDCDSVAGSPPWGGLEDYEGVLFDRAYSPFFAEAGLDTLYTSVHYNWDGAPPTRWNGSVIAQRYEATPADTLAGTAHGRVIMFFFQPYPFLEGPTVDAGTAAINWLMTGQDY